MATVRFADLQSRPTEFLDFTSLTLDEFQQLIRPSRRRSKRIWPRGASMANPAPPAGLACTRTAPADTRRPAVLPAHLPENLQPPSGPGTPVRHGPEQSQSVDPRPPARTTGRPAPLGDAPPVP